VDNQTFIQSYEGYFSCKLPVEFDGEHNPKNPVEYRLWAEFIDAVGVPIERLMSKAAEMRGRSRMRPSLADLRQALNACQGDRSSSDRRVDCALCNGCGWMPVLAHYDPNQPWRRTAKVGHYYPEGYVLLIVAVPCLCSAGIPQIRDGGNEFFSRLAHDWRINFDAQARIDGEAPLQLAQRLVGESWSRLREDQERARKEAVDAPQQG
jgi:hypothetical protein